MTALANIRRAAVMAAATLTLAACSGGKSGPAVGTGADMTQGSPTAPVKVMEYASPTCPHCARFNADVFPAFKKKYIDTGKVEYIFREMPVHPALDGPVFLLARCAGKDKYFTVIDAVMRAQPEYFRSDSMTQVGADLRPVLMRVAQSVGLNEQQAIACMSDADQVKKMNDRVEAEAKQYSVEATPTFVVDGKKVEPSAGGEPDLAFLDSVIQPELAKKKS